LRRLARELWAVARLDFAEVIRSRWMLFCAGVYALLGGTFVLVGMRESMVHGFSGMGRVLLSMVHTLLILLPLIALTATGQVINRARDDGTLELVFSLPIRRGPYFAAVSLTRYVSLVAPLVALMLVMSLVGRFAFHQDIHWSFIGQAMAISAALAAAFVGIGVAISTLVRNQTRAVIWLLFVWALGAALLDFGLIGAMLRWRLNPESVFLLATLNPVQAARMALLAGVSPELSVLGPVGFYLSTRVGASGLYALGVLWPTALGIGAWLLSLRSFSRSDIV
jgi:ABC-2 type transport system permease protein